MAPNSKILLIRHGEAVHNLDNNFGLHDPVLTDLGKEQCVKLLKEAFEQGEWKEFNKLQLIVISPLLRTIQTGYMAFKKPIANGVKVIILPEIQETSPRPCDTGRPTAELQELFPEVDFSELSRTNWLHKQTGFYHRDYLKDRAMWVRKWLNERPEEYIAVVTHSGFLRWLTPQYFPNVENRDAYRNCEYRAYTFADPAHDMADGSPYLLVESKWSKELRELKRAEAGKLITPSGEEVTATSEGVPSGSGTDGACDEMGETLIF